jgi:polysaccharide export outer membrane protein
MNHLARSIVGVSCAVLCSAPVAAQVTPPRQTGQSVQDSLRREAERRLGRTVTNQEIVERLRQSGMTQSQARSRLQQMGYDPAIADAYFARLSATDTMTGVASRDFVRALADIGLMETEAAALPDTINLQGRRMGGRPESGPPDPNQVFGRNLFARESNEFVPSIAGPVDPGYQLGPGDELQLILTGDVEAAYPLRVSREGVIVIPDVGQIPVAGMTLGQLENLLYDRLGRVYSGVRRGQGATTQFQIGLGRLRNILVYVAGDVEVPSAYNLSAASTVFHALYQAGGPNETGSFRRIEVRRGGDVIRTVDLYDYLLRGDSRNDIRLQHNDIIFIPPAARQVRIQGEVRRPGTYELREDDDLRDLLSFAAGVQPGAILRNVQIDRILPPAQRSPGVDRTIVDVPLEEIMRTGGTPIPLQDGDQVQVSAVSDEVRNRLSVTGSVHRPGLYEWRKGMTLRQLLDRAEGVSENALLGRAHIFRLNVEDGTRRLHRFSLVDTATFMLADRDSIVIYDRAELAAVDSVTVDGLVRQPGRYALAAGMGIKDLILTAGGLEPGAYLLAVEVARRQTSLTRNDSLATVYRLPLSSVSSPDGANGARSVNDMLSWAPGADEFELLRDDHIIVRRMPGDEELQPVRITGEVQFPGTYVLQNRQERVSSLMIRSGGLASDAHAEGIQVWRKGSLMGIDVSRAIADPGSRFNVALEAGDSIHVPRYDPTVLVQGAVGFEQRVLFVPGKPLMYYIDQAGGFAENADRDRLSIAYANGERDTRRTSVFYRRDPEVRPGAAIFVPAESAEQRSNVNWDGVLTRTLSILTAVATLVLTYNQIK